MISDVKTMLHLWVTNIPYPDSLRHPESSGRIPGILNRPPEAVPFGEAGVVGFRIPAAGHVRWSVEGQTLENDVKQ